MTQRSKIRLDYQTTDSKLTQVHNPFSSLWDLSQQTFLLVADNSKDTMKLN